MSQQQLKVVFYDVFTSNYTRSLNATGNCVLGEIKYSVKVLTVSFSHVISVTLMVNDLKRMTF